MKKIFFLLFVSSLVFSVFANGDKETDSSAKVKVNPAGVLPIVNELTPLSVMMSGATHVEDYPTNAYTLWLEEQTNVKATYSIVMEDNVKDKLNISLAGGTYPEVLVSMDVTPTQEVLYAEQGIFQNLKDIVPEYAPNFQKLLEDYPNVKAKTVHGDGDIFGMVSINKCFHCDYGQKAWIYYPWLEKLGLEVPETTEELYNVLMAFKTQDPNGNGIADEIPLAGATTGWHAFVDGYLMKAFIYNDMKDRLIVENGKVTPVYTDDKWQEGLRYIKRLYDDGLIAGESFTQTVQGLRQMNNNPEGQILGAFTFGSAIGGTRPNNEASYQMVTLPPLEGPDGTKLAFYDAYQGIATGNFIVTDKCDNPEMAVRWGDFMYTEEANMRAVYGIPGVDWRDATASDGVDLRDRPARFYRMTLFGDVQNSHWMQKGLNVRTYDLRQSWAFKLKEGLVVAPSPYNGSGEKGLYEATKDLYEPYGFPFENQIPPMDYTELESEILADTKVMIQEYVNESIARFITGDRDINTDWDSYKDELNAIGLQDMLKVIQAAYERTVK